MKEFEKIRVRDGQKELLLETPVSGYFLFFFLIRYRVSMGLFKYLKATFCHQEA